MSENLTGIIIGKAFEVMNALGSGFLEKVYENALALELMESGHLVESQKKLPVFYRGAAIGEYVADLIVGGKVIVEIKAVRALEQIHSAQVVNYLKATGMQTGLLLNFGSPKVEVKRLYHPSYPPHPVESEEIHGE